MIYSFSKAITTAGTAEPLMGSRTMVNWAIIQAKEANTKSVAVGDADVSVSGAKGALLKSSLDSVELPYQGRPAQYDLAKVYVDVAESLEGVQGIYDA